MFFCFIKVYKLDQEVGNYIPKVSFVMIIVEKLHVVAEKILIDALAWGKFENFKFLLVKLIENKKGAVSKKIDICR